jgi:hypothetical protein
MAVKIAVVGALTYGSAGSPFGSEILLSAAAGPTYLASSVTLLNQQSPSIFPCVLQLVKFPPAAGGIEIQYTPDAGVTWRSLGSQSSMWIYADGSTTRIFNNSLTASQLFITPIRALA